MKLKNMVNIINGSTPSTSNPEFWGGDIKWITPKDMSSIKTRYISYGNRNITELGYNSCSTTLVPKGTVLLTSRAPIGYVAIADNSLCTNQGFKSMICNENLVKPMYLYYWLLKNREYLVSIAGGSTFKELSKEQLENVDIELPNLEIQQHIVNTIGTVDNLIEKTLEILNSIKKLRRLLYKHFSLNSISTVPFKEIVTFENGAQPPKSEHIYE
ncbi:restriction endonuclease subunit S [Mycoplasmopsis iners]|uniref:restriction endonuclease subunit S n=1 Tax=Mycoplasmopsis iners TaxID=76630 RepID=UPI00068B443C|nr:restriction endonuclease subunit S [Mycoplasmopsis iners]